MRRTRRRAGRAAAGLAGGVRYLPLGLVVLVLAVAFGIRDGAARADGAAWAWPVEGPRQVLRAFVGPPKPWMPGHRGIDIAADPAVLRAPAPGVVRFAGRVVDRGVLSIDHGGGVVSSYEPVETTLSVGDEVHAGDAIATVVPGHCPAPCVHIGVRVDGEYENPLVRLGGAQWPVLLPSRRA